MVKTLTEEIKAAGGQDQEDNRRAHDHDTLNGAYALCF
jgi:hypothetical protein